MRIAFAIVSVALVQAACSSPRGDAITNRASGSGSQTPPPSAPIDPLPLVQGATFIYDVTIVFYDGSTGQEATAQFPWTMTVVEVKGTRAKVTGWLPQLVDFDAKAPYHAPPTRVTELVKTEASISIADKAWFALPLVDGQRTCPDPQQSRYCWQVAADHERFNLSFVTNPDDESFELTPGVGISRYTYRHHGTTMDVTAKLVSHPGG